MSETRSCGTCRHNEKRKAYRVKNGARWCAANEWWIFPADKPCEKWEAKPDA